MFVCQTHATAGRGLHWLIALLAAATLSGHSLAQSVDADQATTIEAAPAAGEDQRIKSRLASIFSEVDTLSRIRVEVSEGVVRLSGEVPNETQAARALELAARVQGIVTVDDQLERTLTIEDNLNPIIEDFYADLRTWVRATPLYLFALFILLIFAGAGHLLANWQSLWKRVLPNPFLAELAAQLIRALAIFIGLIISLNLIGATALIGTILGGIGVLGLAIGFAVRDTIENYVASIMLSLRQPFRSQDHVVIGDHEGIVSRLTSRATILMTLSGNHLRIPNSFVFKAVILNYTRNPERRFEFLLGVDAEDDPGAAMKVGVNVMEGLDWVLDDPAPSAIIESVGDSNIVLKFMGWVDQGDTDFGKGRSLAIRAVKSTLEEAGFTLPEPIYRLRFDNAEPAAPDMVPQVPAPADTASHRARPHRAPQKVDPETPTDVMIDLQPDNHVQEEAGRERALQQEDDLLDNSRPIE